MVLLARWLSATRVAAERGDPRRDGSRSRLLPGVRIGCGSIRSLFWRRGLLDRGVGTLCPPRAPCGNAVRRRFRAPRRLSIETVTQTALASDACAHDVGC